MKTRTFFSVAAALLMGGSGSVIAPAVWAQQVSSSEENPADWTTLRPSFASRLNHLDGVLKGKRTLRVTAFAPSSPHVRFPVLGRNNKVAQLRLDNEPIDESFTNMPHEFSWNTRDFSDGTHVLTIMLLDTVTRETETLDRVVVTLGNNRDDSAGSTTARPEPTFVPEPLPAIPAPTPKRGALASRGGASRDFDRGDFARLSSNIKSNSSDTTAPEKRGDDFGAANNVAPSAALVVEAMKSDRPLMATATALCKANGMLYMGLKTGGIAACNPKTLTGWAVRPSAAVSSAAPKALCADGSGNIYWLTSGAGKTPTPTLFSWNAQTKKVASVSLSAVLPSGASVTLASAGKNVLVQTRKGQTAHEMGAAFLVNPQTGTIEPRETDFGVSDENGDAREDPAVRLDFSPRYTPAQIVAVASANNKTENRWRQIGPDIVAQMDETGDGAYAYMPWNGANKDGKIVAALSDETGVWLATEKGGVRHITPGSPNAENGYDGYVRAHLTDASEFTQDSGGPNAERNEKIAAVVEEWQGTPYLWGGDTKKGTDCSGFVGQVHQALGMKIPRSSDEMRASKQGERVHDELRYGDVLVYPGHVALYIGNGKTAETVGGTPTGSVSKSTIWRRREVAVRRYFQ